MKFREFPAKCQANGTEGTTRSMLPKPSLSLCMIVKNEINNLPRCLASVKPYVDEMIIVDTGSQDGTPEFALEHGAKVQYFEWCNDFSAARNYALSQVASDWILVLDADEELIINSSNILDEITSQPEIIAYSLSLTEAGDSRGMTPLHTPRLFRNLPEIRYTGYYHEQLKYRNQYISNNQISTLKSLSILHYGYGKEQLLQKNIHRNIPILEDTRQKEGLSLMLLYCLAGMYNDTQQPEKAQECCAEGFKRLLPNLINGIPPDEFGFLPSMLYLLGLQTLQQKDYETTRLLCQRGLEWCPNFPPLNYLTGVTIKALGFPLGASAYFKNCIRLGREGNYYNKEPFEVSYMTTYPAYDLGCIYIEMKCWQEAVAAFEMALSFDANFTASQEKIAEIRQTFTNIGMSHS